jgi:Uma2 family endonuclease
MKTAETALPLISGAKAWPLSVAAYHVLGEASLIPKRTELLYGVVYHKMSKSPLHSSLLQFLQEVFHDSVPAELLVRTEQPITCADSELEPDLAVVRGKIADFRTAHPSTAELVVEVCVSSAEYDRSKLRAYASAGIKECWLVLGPERQIEVFRVPAGHAFSEHSLHGPGGWLASTALPGLRVDLAALFGS